MVHRSNNASRTANFLIMTESNIDVDVPTLPVLTTVRGGVRIPNLVDKIPSTIFQLSTLVRWRRGISATGTVFEVGVVHASIQKLKVRDGFLFDDALSLVDMSDTILVAPSAFGHGHRNDFSVAAGKESVGTITGAHEFVRLVESLDLVTSGISLGADSGISEIAVATKGSFRHGLRDNFTVDALPVINTAFFATEKRVGVRVYLFAGGS
mmetsp:Transcript_20825/g.51653  ORF Transcript_20825/g.51653 Transcript_20825/m.51653 type:complete len:210 (+) Transcript_20825:402-1031(+)